MDIDEFESRFVAAVASLPATVQERVLEILDMREAGRAEAIGALYQDPRALGLAELLMDLEAWSEMRRLLAAEIRDQLRLK